MVSQPTDDYALMKAVTRGDESALGALYDRHAGLVFTLCQRIVRDRLEAEDLLIDIFWELWAKSDRYDAARGSPLTYLLTLSRSRAIDRRRSATKRRTIPIETGRDGQDGTAWAQDFRPGRNPVSPAGDVMSRELGERVRAAMAKLEPSQRQAVELSFFDDLSHSEIAERLGKPLGTIKTNIRQGLIRLREYVRMD